MSNQKSEINFLNSLSSVPYGELSKFYSEHGYNRLQVSRLKKKYAFDQDKMNSFCECIKSVNKQLPPEHHFVVDFNGAMITVKKAV